MSGPGDELIIDPEQALDHVADHLTTADDLAGVMDGAVLDANAGIAADAVAALLDRVMTESQAIVDTHRLIAGIVETIARDATLTDEEAGGAFSPFDEELLGL